MIHPDFELIETGHPPRQEGPVLLCPSTQDIITALSNMNITGHSYIVLLRETMPLPSELPYDVYLQTSGTTGKPKLVGHRLGRLLGKIKPVDPALPGAPETWYLTYHPASFAGLQVILTASQRGAKLVTGNIETAIAHGVTHISATATFWRLFLSELGSRSLDLKAITLGGERADQAILDALKRKFPTAHLTHIYASTEAGAVFSVKDGLEGFPAKWLKHAPDGISLRVDADGVLEIESPRATVDNWISTGDLVERHGDRIHFIGRVDDIINVGGTKIHPSKVEDITLSVNGVQDARCYGKANPVTGQIVALDVISLPGQDESALKSRLKGALADLDRAAQPRLIRIVEQIRSGTGNKKIRTE